MDKEKLAKQAKHLRVLYVEDSLTIRNMLAKKLIPLFKQLDIAENGEVGLEKFKNFYENEGVFYDIVISDLEMPLLPGDALAKILLDFNPTQEIIMISSSEEFARVIELINAGVKKFLPKPVEEDTLYGVISQVVQNLRQKRLEEDEQKEIEEYNKILEKKEEIYRDRLREERNELTEFKDALDVSAIISKTDENGIITYVNDKFCKVSGYKREELIGQNQDIVNSGNMDEHVYQRLWETLRRQKIYRGLFENRTKEGDIYFIETVISPILNLEGEVKEFIAISYNMTKLIDSMEEMKRIQHSKEYFFINMSHEMKTPLNSIIGFLSILERRAKGNDTLLNIISTIQGSSADLQHIIQAVLDINKLQDKTLSLKEEVFDVKELFNKCSMVFHENAVLKNQKLEGNVTGEFPPCVYGDAKRIKQVVSIVVDNAIKFTSKGGSISLTVRYDNNKECLAVEVKDTGIGIDEKDQKRIFHFEQLDDSFTRRHEGAGLGLTIATGLMHLLKGTISVVSAPNKGSIFSMEFPLKAYSN